MIKRILALVCLSFAVSVPSLAQRSGPFNLTANSQCATIHVSSSASSTVAISVTGTWSATLQPEVVINGQAAANAQVSPSTAVGTPQSTITQNGVYQASIAGMDLFEVCTTSYASGTAVVYLNISTGSSSKGGGGSSGSGTVTGVLGTTNQIASDGSPTTPTLSIPSTFIAPGSIAATTSLTSGANSGAAGSLILNGSTSGSLNCTAPAAAGTAGNPLICSNALQLPNGTQALPALRLTTNPYGWYYASGIPGWVFSNGSNADNIGLKGNSSQIGLASNGFVSFGSSTSALNAANMNSDTTESRCAAGCVQIGTGATANRLGLLLSGDSVFVTSNFTTSGVGTALENITGLSWTFPAVALNYNFHCHMAYSQAVGAAAVAFGIKATTTAPTNIFATGEMFTAAGTVTTGTLATLTTTTATNIVSGTPGAQATNFVADLYGTMELGAGATTINIMTSTSTAADLVTVLRGSYCSLAP